MKKNDEQFWCSNWVVTGISPKLNYIYIYSVRYIVYCSLW
jgi:hypothetical protein